MPAAEHVTVVCPGCRHYAPGKIAFGRTCPDCGGSGEQVVPRSWAESQGLQVLPRPVLSRSDLISDVVDGVAASVAIVAAVLILLSSAWR